MKVKAKARGNTVKVKAMFKSAMMGKEEAAKKKMQASFITHIVAKVNGRIVYEVSTGPFISKNPLFKFKFTGASKGEQLEITTTDNRGKQKTKLTKIK